MKIAIDINKKIIQKFGCPKIQEVYTWFTTQIYKEPKNTQILVAIYR
jgi:hypothetical protein